MTWFNVWFVITMIAIVVYAFISGIESERVKIEDKEFDRQIADINAANAAWHDGQHVNARALALWNRDEIYKHDLHALLADGAKDGCHTDVGTKLREQLIQLHANVAMLRAALLAEIIYPVTGPAHATRHSESNSIF